MTTNTTEGSSISMAATETEPAITEPTDPASGANGSDAGQTSQSQTEPGEKTPREPSPYVVLLGTTPAEAEGMPTTWEPVTVDGEKIGDVYDQPGEGPSVFRALSQKDARKAAAVALDLPKALLAKGAKRTFLAAVPAASWKPTQAAIKHAEPELAI